MERLKKIVLVFCVIFTTITIIYFLMYNNIPSKVLFSFISVAFIDSLLTFLLEEKEKYSNNRLFFNHILFAFLVLLSIILASLLNNYKITFLSLTANGLVIAFLFIFIKFLLYRQDQKVANEINKFLSLRKQ